MDIIQAENITKEFTRHRALDNVSISVPEGKVYGLLGPNGAGKTTLIRIITHITAPDKGSVTFNGHPLTAEDVVNIGYLPEERGLYKKMKVGEQAIFFARLKGLSRKDAESALKQWFERLDITSWWSKKVEELSKGMAQKVQFIITVLHKPQLLIFDEPFSGFDPINANILKHEILRLRDEGATVIFSTHNMASVEELCDNITLINNSHNILTGNVKDLRRQYGGNRYELSFTGDRESLQNQIRPIVKDLHHDDDDRDGNHRMVIELNSPDDRRSVIDIANKTVGLESIRPLLMSMDEIFIKAVEESNNPTPPAIES